MCQSLVRLPSAVGWIFFFFVNAVLYLKLRICQFSTGLLCHADDISSKCLSPKFWILKWNRRGVWLPYLFLVCSPPRMKYGICRYPAYKLKRKQNCANGWGGFFGYPMHALVLFSRGFPKECQLDVSFSVCAISLGLLLVHFFPWRHLSPATYPSRLIAPSGRLSCCCYLCRISLGSVIQNVNVTPEAMSSSCSSS